MNSNYLIRRFLSFIIDTLLFYVWGFVIYYCVGQKEVHFGLTRIEISIIILSILVIVSEVWYQIYGGSIGQKLLRLKNNIVIIKYGKLLPAVVKSIILCFFFIIPVIIPPVLIIINLLIHILTSISTYKSNRKLFIDILSGIDVIESNYIK